MTELIVLAIGAHPDDVELSCGGTLALMAADGARTVIVDLTRGEMGTRGTPEARAAEAEEGRVILGAAARENIDLGDARLVADIANRRALAATIRRHRPAIILAPWIEDRHPDHAAAGQLAAAALFAARLAKADPDRPPAPAALLLHYPSHTYAEPTLVVDITAAFAVKMRAVAAHVSQFGEDRSTRIDRASGVTDYAFYIESRCRHFGSLIGCPYGEGFIVPGPLALPNLGLLVGGRP